MRRVLVTGANGFVGTVLCETLVRSGFEVRAAVRDTQRQVPPGTETTLIGDIGANTDWSSALRGVDCVVHLAARAHILGDPRANEAAYFETNGRGTECLSSQAARAGVRRLVYLSSVKVNGEETPSGAFSATDRPNPQDSYGVSKWEGEQRLWDVSGRTGMQAVVVRSPLVYGPGVRANFLRLMRMVDRGLPLPLGAVHNRRRLVSVWNLSNLLGLALVNEAAAGRTWMVSDGEDLSTPDLVRRIGNAMGRRARLFPVPVAVLLLCGTLAGKRQELTRLCGSLAVDISATREQLGWIPPMPAEEGIGRTVGWYLARDNGG
jgi:nucleoside-diphosphate-sugar epimerase